MTITQADPIIIVIRVIAVGLKAPLAVKGIMRLCIRAIILLTTLL